MSVLEEAGGFQFKRHGQTGVPERQMQPQMAFCLEWHKGPSETTDSLSIKDSSHEPSLGQSKTNHSPMIIFNYISKLIEIKTPKDKGAIKLERLTPRV